MDFDASSPIWLQLVAEFSRRISVGVWPSGSRLPGVRDLAAELGVNPNTVQRALAELDRQGVTYSERTSGRFVTDDQQKITDLRNQQAAAGADDFIARCAGLGISSDQARQLIADRWAQTVNALQESQER